MVAKLLNFLLVLFAAAGLGAFAAFTISNNPPDPVLRREAAAAQVNAFFDACRHAKSPGVPVVVTTEPGYLALECLMGSNRYRKHKEGD